MLRNLRGFREEVIWAAALIDGEGSMGVYTGRPSEPDRKRSHIQCAMTHRYPLLRLKRLFGGTIYRRKRVPRCKQAWQWRIQGYRAYAAAVMLYQFLTIKRKAAEKIIKHPAYPVARGICRRGHTMVEENLQFVHRRGNAPGIVRVEKVCAICMRARSRAYLKRQREKKG